MAIPRIPPFQFDAGHPARRAQTPPEPAKEATPARERLLVAYLSARAGWLTSSSLRPSGSGKKTA